MFFPKNNEKAQASIEYVIIVALTLTAVAILSAYSFFMLSGTSANNELISSAKELKSAINTVYSLGSGNSLVTTISFPAGISQIVLGNKYFMIEANIFGNPYKEYTDVDANLTGSLPINAGTYDIVVSNVDGVVNLNVA